jgi:hypothetical protein
MNLIFINTLYFDIFFKQEVALRTSIKLQPNVKKHVTLIIYEFQFFSLSLLETASSTCNKL